MKSEKRVMTSAQRILSYALLLVATLGAVTARASSLEHWSAHYQVGGQEFGVTQAVSVSETTDISREEAEMLAAFFIEQEIPVAVIEPLPAAASSDSASAKLQKTRRPASEQAEAGPNFKWLVAQLRAHRLVDAYQFTRTQLNNAARATVDLGRFYAKAPAIYREELSRNRPGKPQVAFGIVFTAYTTAAKTFAWLSAPGVSPAMAIAIGAAHGAFSGVASLSGAAFNRTFGRPLAFKVGQAGPGDEIPANDPAHAMRRRVFNYLFYGILAFSSGGGSIPLGLATIIRTIPPMLMMIEGRSLIAPLINDRYLKETTQSDGKKGVSPQGKNLETRLQIVMAFLAMPLAFMDGAGAGAVILNLGFYTIRSYTVASLGIYLGIWAGLKYAPDKLKALLEMPERLKSLAVSGAERIRGIARRWQEKKRTPKPQAKRPALIGAP